MYYKRLQKHKIHEQGSTFTFACEIPYIASSLFNIKCTYFYTVTYMMIEKDQWTK